MRKRRAIKRDVLADPMYNSKLVTKLINQIMIDGKKGTAQTILYNAFKIIEAKTEEEWINLSEVGITLSKRVPGFDPRNYKYQKLRQLIESFDAFETKAIPNPHNKLLKIVYVKEKEYS